MKRKISFTLALLMLVLASCSDNQVSVENEKTDTAADIVEANTTEETVEVIEEEDIDQFEILEPIDYTGSDFMILNDTVSNWWTISLWSEGMNGEIINDTVYKRNTAVEDKYNVKILNTESTNVESAVSDTVKAGLDEYDMVWERINCLLPMAEKGYLLNLNSFDTFNFDAPWWDPNARDAFTINGKLFFGCNDINIHTMEGCSTIYFSKTLRETNNLDNPYELVREGKWTLDVMSGMMQTVAADTNGDGTRNEGDTFGLVTGIGQYLSLVNGAGAQLVTLSYENGETSFSMNINSDKTIAASEKIANMLNDKNLTVIVNDDGWGYDAFYTDHSLFYIMQLGSIAPIRDLMETDFGILPFPMMNEEQGYYTTCMEATAQAMCYPQTVSDKSYVGTITEAMAIYSDRYLTDAFYETTLKGKIARDQDTNEMLDILTNNRTFDYSTCYSSWNVYSTYLANIQTSGAEGLASASAKIEKSFKKMSQKTLDNITALEDN